MTTPPYRTGIDGSLMPLSRGMGHCCFAGCTSVTCNICGEQRCVRDFHLCGPEAEPTDENAKSFASCEPLCIRGEHTESCVRNREQP